MPKLPTTTLTKVALLALAISAVIASGRSAESSTNGLQADYAFETGSFMRSTAYHNPDSIGRGMKSDGAFSKVNIEYDKNRTGKWYIEEQREGARAIAAGISNSDADAIDRGLRIIDWGWRQQQSDGGFDCGSLGRTFHSTAFFVEASAHACLLLQASPYADQYRDQIDAMKPKLLSAARWMVSHEDAGIKYNRPYTHRQYMVADALGETGLLCRDEDLIEESRKFVETGLAMQDPTGYNPEKGGYDVSYNAGGLVFAERYYNEVADARLRGRLYTMLKNAIAWQASRVRPDGSVDTTGSTRIDAAHAETGPNGTRKKLAVGQVHESFGYWAQISGDRSYEDLAIKVAHGPRDKD